MEGLRGQELLASGEIIVVDNGSTDGTGEAARNAGARVVREGRRGYGYACLAGVLAADAEVIVLLDGDAADDPDDLSRVLEPLLEGEAELVVGSRALGTRAKGSMTWQQIFGNNLAAFLMRALCGVRVSDVGPFRAIRREDLLALQMREMTYGWPSEMIVKSVRAGTVTARFPYATTAGSASPKWGTHWSGASRSDGGSSPRSSATPAGSPATRSG